MKLLTHLKCFHQLVNNPAVLEKLEISTNTVGNRNRNAYL